MPVLVEIGLAGPARAEAFLGLHAVVLVHGVDGELAQRRHHALLAERPDDEIGVDALDLVQVENAVGLGGDAAEPDPLGFERRGHGLALLARGMQRRLADRVQVGGHLARQQFDQPGAHQVIGVALVGELRVGGVEIGVGEALVDEDVDGEVAGAAHHGLAVAAGAGIGLRAGDALEDVVGRALALGRDDRLGGHLAAGAVEFGEFRAEQRLATGDQRIEGRAVKRAGQRRLVDMGGDGALRPGHVAGGGRARAKDGKHERGHAVYHRIRPSPFR